MLSILALEWPGLSGRRTALIAGLCMALSAWSPPGWGQDEPPTLPIERLVPQISAQVVQVIARQPAGTSFGSAVPTGAGRMVTSCHVLGVSEEVYVVVGIEPRRVRVLASDPFHDLCVLTRPDGMQPVVPICRASAQVAIGEESFAVGFASGRLGFSRGRVLARYALDGGHVLRTGAGFLPGASGGGLFDDRGRLIGVLTVLRRAGASPAYLAVPCEWLDQLHARTDGPAHGASAAEDQGRSARLAFWQLLDHGNEDVPWFMQALRLEAEERWPELEALAKGRQADHSSAEAAIQMAELARRMQGFAPAPAAVPTVDAGLAEQDDAQCQSNGGRLVVLERPAAPSRVDRWRVWVERWHLGIRTADRSRHDLAPGQSVALGCSRTIDGEQRWEIVDRRLLER